MAGKKIGKASGTRAAAAKKTATPPAPGQRMRIPAPDRAVVDALDELFGGRSDLRKGAMFGCPGYFLGAKAVACVFGDELCVTVPSERVEALVQQPGYRRFVAARGRAMNGWVLLDQDRIFALEPGDELLEAAIAHARSKAAAPGKAKPGKAKPSTAKPKAGRARAASALR